MYLADLRRYRVTLGAIFLLLLGLAACGSEEAGREKVARPTPPAVRTATAPTVGGEDNPCAPDGSCDLGLVCNGGRCVEATRVCTVLHGRGTQAWDNATSALGPCTSLTCDANYHLEGDACASNTRTCSPLPANTIVGTQTWNSATSAYGSCTATTCASTFHVESGACLSDTRSCTIANGTGSQTYAAGSWGTCGIVSCNSAFHAESGACVSDTRSCGIVNGTGSENYVSGSWGTCGIVRCNTSYHVEGAACVSDTRSCAIANGTGSQSYAAGSWSACGVVSCNSAFHIESSACLSNTRTCSPLPANTTAGTQTWTGSSYGSCTATTCASGYSVVGGVCLANLSTACTLNAECASGFCATGPTGTTNDRCAPTGMNYIPAGTFTMGSPSGEVGQATGETQHSVTLSRSFFMGQTEVTQGQWKALSGGINPSYFQNSTCTNGSCLSDENANDSGPVEQMDWYAAVAYANARSAAEGLTSCYTLTGCTDAATGWKDGIHSGCTGATFGGLTCTGYRLPTESEWEYAARGGTTGATYLGNLSGTVTDCSTAQANLDGIAWWCRNSGDRTNAVGGKAANSFGLSDMLGNVWEWTGDWYGTYPGTVTDPLGAGTGSYRVSRGGSWLDNARSARAAFRYIVTPGFRGGPLGFRLSRTVTRGCTTLPLNATAGVEAGNATGWDACEATACASGYSVVGGVCLANLSTACTLNAECTSGVCATGPTGTANDRCAPTGMNFIPAGTFTMGSPSGEVGRATDETEHSVTITRSFFMGQTEVTQGQWKALSGGINPSYFQSTTGTAQSTANANDSGPVEYLDWYAAVAFANARSAAEGLTSCYTLTGCADATNGWKDGIHSGCTVATFSGLTCTGYRLPTESEWEYAARGGTTTATYQGNLSGTVTDCTTAQANLDGIAWWCRNSGSRTNAVGGKTANSFGLSDMLGNVYEWTGDGSGTYPGTVTDPLGAGTSNYRVYRGGTWYDTASLARAALRYNAGPVDRKRDIGFRLSRTAP